MSNRQFLSCGGGGQINGCWVNESYFEPHWLIGGLTQTRRHAPAILELEAEKLEWWLDFSARVARPPSQAVII